MSNQNEILYAVYKKGHGSRDEAYDIVRSKVAVTKDDLKTSKDDLDRLVSLDINMTTVVDENYPLSFKNAHSRPPFVLFYKGRLDLLKKGSGLGLVSFDTPSSLARRHLDKVVSDLNDFDDTVRVEKIVMVYDTSIKDVVLKATRRLSLVLFFLKGLDVLDEEEKGLADIVVKKGGLVVSILLPGVNKATKVNKIDTYSCLIASVSSVYFPEYYEGKRGKKERTDQAILNIALGQGRDILVSPRGVYFDEVFESSHDDSNSLIKDGATIVFNKDSLKEALTN